MVERVNTGGLKTFEYSKKLNQKERKRLWKDIRKHRKILEERRPKREEEKLLRVAQSLLERNLRETSLIRARETEAAAHKFVDQRREEKNNQKITVKLKHFFNNIYHFLKKAL